MEALYLLIAVSVLVLCVVGGVFVWAVASGQFDDLIGPAYRILGDDDENS